MKVKNDIRPNFKKVARVYTPLTIELTCRMACPYGNYSDGLDDRRKRKMSDAFVSLQAILDLRGRADLSAVYGHQGMEPFSEAAPASAVAYVRRCGDGDEPIEYQATMARITASAICADVLAVYQDELAGPPAVALETAGLRMLLAAMSLQRVDVVIVETLDRLGNEADVRAFARMLDVFGVRLVCYGPRRPHACGRPTAAQTLAAPEPKPRKRAVPRRYH